MSLSDKYGIDPEKVKRLIKDGWISCLVSRDEEIYNCYRSNLSKGISKPESIRNAADFGKLSERQVYNIIHKFE